jgi:hypothetical protein
MVRLAMSSPVMFAIAALVLAAAPAGAAEECPTRGLDPIEGVLREAPTCSRSLVLFQACAFGASGDVVLGAVVREKCERDFLDKLKPPDRKAYERAQNRCALKHRTRSGTMYRAFEAFCGAELAAKYSRRLQRAAGTSKP